MKSEEIWALISEVFRADDGWSGAGMKGRGKREIPEKTYRPTASSGTIPTYENPVTRPGIKPGSPWWEASVLIAQPPWPHYCSYAPPTSCSIGTASLSLGAPSISHVGIVPDDAAGRQVFWGNLPFHPPFNSGAAPCSQPSSALMTSLLRAVKISPLQFTNFANSFCGEVHFKRAFVSPATLRGYSRNLEHVPLRFRACPRVGKLLYLEPDPFGWGWIVTYTRAKTLAENWRGKLPRKWVSCEAGFNNKVFRADEDEIMAGKREILEETRVTAASFGTIPTRENPGVTRSGIETGSTWWEASSLTAQPSRTHGWSPPVLASSQRVDGAPNGADPETNRNEKIDVSSARWHSGFVFGRDTGSILDPAIHIPGWFLRKTTAEFFPATD
ncbi:hypothetical protein PR048_026472 [Dryococelus australis]|uniref:Nudix hydrolase domain-containing protein n=1 Tax=Dryococelus australis TaxID=614101 RepID=A0ABQ9GLF3_9NEOP|nr:hypothetical protein PR048_026472 [Dryococelus australis]